MKKFQILGTVLLLSVVTILLVACQKEQDGVTNEVNNRNTSETITAIEVNASDIPGIIDRDEAAKMAARYANSGVNKSLAVSFDIKDIQNYLSVLRRSGSSKIYVNFGMYENGRMTVFFSGDKKTNNGNVRGNFDDAAERFLNHGGLVP
ncbi:hypothetical protein KACHI17_22650 [Sediminibacterium sp. KACHI17]|jgi:hypothetical protein|uniref:Lipoprotein n=1 Tax=Sediminibacterium sp. KACHI17 TaxID=1751071 RepID=A0AAT9GL23_9BACT